MRIGIFRTIGVAAVAALATLPGLCVRWRRRPEDDRSEPGARSPDPSAPSEPAKPKRGAFPTPRSEVEKARPFIPEGGDAGDFTVIEPDPSAELEGEEDG